MRINHYRFPKETEETVRLKNGCSIVLKTGETTYADSIPEECRPLVDYVDDVITCSVTQAKVLLRRYGGAAWTEHLDRDGGLFEVTAIELDKNNSRHRYNRHL